MIRLSQRTGDGSLALLALAFIDGAGPLPDDTATRTRIGADGRDVGQHRRHRHATEGANLAIGVDRDTDAMVIALQGRLYRVWAGAARRAPPLRGLLDDAWAADPASDGASAIDQSYRSGAWEPWRVATTAGAAPEWLTASAYDDREPRHGPGDPRILFSSDLGGGCDVWRLGPDHSAPRPLTRPPGDQYGPAWAPDGRRFAYIERTEEGWRIRTAPLAGDAAHGREALRSDAEINGLAWLPERDGLSFQRLAYGDLVATLVARDALVAAGSESPFTSFGTDLHAGASTPAPASRRTGSCARRPATRRRSPASSTRSAPSSPASSPTWSCLTVDPLAGIRDADNVVMTVSNGHACTLEELMSPYAYAP